MRHAPRRATLGSRRSDVRRGAVALVAGAAIGVSWLTILPGCTTTAPSFVATSAEARDGELVRVAQREAKRPVQAAEIAPPPPGVDAAAFEPVDADDPVARLSLAEAIRRFGSAPSPDRGPSDAAPVDALRLYASGRAALLSNDVVAAERDLRAAAELDTWSPEIRATLAEALLARGNRIGATAEFRDVLVREPENIRALEHLGREAAEVGDDERAVELLSRAWRLPLMTRDAALPYVIGASLGAALHRQGWLAAGNEALELAATIPEPFPTASRYSRDIGILYRSRPDHWRDIGDAWLRLGDAGDALRAYREAAAYPSLDDGEAILLRRVLAAMKVGSPAAAALAVVEDARRVGRIEDRHVGLVRHIVSHGGHRDAMLRAIDATVAGFEPESVRRNGSEIARARAAAMDDAQAVSTLRARIVQSPADAAALDALYARLAPLGPGGAIRETITLIQASPMHEPRFTRSLLRAWPSSQALNDAWRQTPAAEAQTPAGRLLRARLVALREPAASEQSLVALLADHPGYTPALVAQIETLVQLGRVAEADEALQSLDAETSADARYAKVLALQAMQRYREARDVLAPLLPPVTPGERADPLHVLRAAELSMAISDFPAAATWYALLAVIDPSRDEAYAGLITLYAPGGPLANEGKLTQTLRELRENAPSSRTLRRLAAREMAAVGQVDRATRELLDLVTQDPSDREALALLVAVWLSAGRADLAEPWLREQLELRPGDGALIGELARTLAQSDRAGEAESLLRRRLDEHPDDLEASRRLEAILRGPLSRPDEADALAAIRLARSPRVPDTAIELAEVQVRRGAIFDAASIVEEALGAGVTLRPDQAERLANAALLAADKAVNDDALIAPALALIDVLRQHASTLPEPAHRARIVLLARTDDGAGAAEAAREATRQTPAGATTYHLLAIQALAERQHYAEALAVAEQAGTTARPLDPRIGSAWLGLTFEQSDGESGERAVRVIVEDGRIDDVLNVLLQRRIDNVDETPADFAHLIGNFFSQAGHEDDADRLYRLSLEYDPRHAMSNNNLGYRMLERGEDIDAAERMIETAYEQRPDDVAIVDSLGWARYLRGVYDDAPGEDGRIIPGAVTLLQRAADLTAAAFDEVTYIVIHDHLGDAQWAAGKRDEAAEAWRRASGIADKTIADLNLDSLPDDQLDGGMREVLTRAESLRAKLEAAAAGEDPPIAVPVHAPPAAPNDANPF